MVPLLMADEALGVLYAAQRRPYPWAEAEQHALDRIGQDLALRLRQLDVDGRREERVRVAEQKYERTLGAQRECAVLAGSLAAQEDSGAALDLLALKVGGLVELRNRDGRLLRSAGDVGDGNPRVVWRRELQGTGGLTISVVDVVGLDEVAAATVELATGLFRLQFFRLREHERTVEQLHGEMLDQLLTGRVADPDAFRQRLLTMGFAAAEGQVVVIGGKRGDLGRDSQLAGVLSDAFAGCTTGVRSGRLVALVEPGPDVRARLESVLARAPHRREDAMKLITFTAGDQVHVGAIDGSGRYAISLTSASKGDPRFASMLDLIRGGEPALADAAEIVELHPVDAAFDLETVTLKAPLPNLGRPRPLAAGDGGREDRQEGATAGLAGLVTRPSAGRSLETAYDDAEHARPGKVAVVAGVEARGGVVAQDEQAAVRHGSTGGGRHPGGQRRGHRVAGHGRRPLDHPGVAGGASAPACGGARQAARPPVGGVLDHDDVAGPDVPQRPAADQDAVARVERGPHALAVDVDHDVAVAQPGDEGGGPGERARGGEDGPGHGAGTSMAGTGW
ncbi:hypothetical protein [Actinomadura sp. B10D3]|uniref:hypothetical protein n=1 Tax=Actinomadura sp. B10D3 TaxID=3153557 RepID=UPI00325CB824